jgi:hypothetical protein
MSAEVAHQLSIFVANKPGVLGKVCDLLKKEKVNIFAITTSDNCDHSVIRLVVDLPQRAVDLLEDFGTLVQEADVIMIDGPNKPGTIAEMAYKLGAANVNIEYLYCATPPSAKTGLLIFKPSNVAKALKILNQRRS